MSGLEALPLRHPVSGVFILIALSACAAGSGRDETTGSRVPAAAPDSVPASILEDAALVEVAPGDLVSTRILTVYFEVGASVAQRAAAIEAVSGTVIGGVAGSVEGLYLVEVDGDGTTARIDSLAAVLQSLPQVSGATPYSLTRP